MWYAILGMFIGLGMIDTVNSRTADIIGLFIFLISASYIALLIMRAKKDRDEPVEDKLSDIIESNQKNRKFADLDPYFERWLDENGGIWRLVAETGRLKLIKKNKTIAYFVFSDFTDDKIDSNDYCKHVAKWLECKRDGNELRSKNYYS